MLEGDKIEKDEEQVLKSELYGAAHDPLQRRLIRERLIEIKRQKIAQHEKLLKRIEADREYRLKNKPIHSDHQVVSERSSARGRNHFSPKNSTECENKKSLLKKYEENSVKDQHRHLPSVHKKIAISKLRADWTIEDKIRNLEQTTMPSSKKGAGTKAAFAMFQQKDKETGGSGKAKSVPTKLGTKEIMLEWCKSHTKNYTNVDITNYSSSWANGMAFCALVHSFFPDSFDFEQLDPKNREHNFDLAFRVAQEKANVAPLLATEDMLLMGDKPDWKCVFTYVQALYKGLSSFQKEF